MRRIFWGLFLLASIAFAQDKAMMLSGYSEGVAAFCLPGASSTEWNKCGYRDVSGNWIIPPQFAWAGIFHEGYALVITGPSGRSTSVVMDPRKVGKEKRRAGGEVVLFDGHPAVIDKTGRVLMGLPSMGRYLVIRKGWRQADVSFLGEPLLKEYEPVYLNAIGGVTYQLSRFRFKEGLAAVDSPGSCSYIRKVGDALAAAFPQSFAGCNDFSEGLARVTVLAQKNTYLYGFIGTDGQWVIPARYSDAADFSEGLASVKTGKFWDAIDRTGATVLKTESANSFAFSEGLAYLMVLCADAYHWCPRFIDKRGQMAFELSQEQRPATIGGFHDGLVRLEIPNPEDYSKPGHTEFLDTTGALVFKFDEARCSDFRQGRAACWYDPLHLTQIVFDKNGTIIEKAGNPKKLAMGEAALAARPGAGKQEAAQASIQGAIRREQGYPDDAIMAFDEAVRLDPGNAHYHMQLAEVLCQVEEYDRAFQEFGESIRLQPQAAERYDARAGCFLVQGQYERALTDFNKALELNPSFANALGGRADVYYFTGRYREAIDEYTAFLKLSPQTPTAYERRGWSHHSLANYPEALADYEKAVALNPKSFAGYSGLAWLLATSRAVDLRNGPKAVEYAEKALSLAGAERNYLPMDTLAAAYAEAGRWTEAIATQTKAIEQLPKNFDAKGAAEYSSRLQSYKAHKPWRE